MNLLIAGSRDLGWLQAAYFATFDHARHILARPVTLVISGGARGVDKAAEQWAETRGFPFQEYPANWDRYGKSAGYVRNKVMVESCDAAIIVWDGKSRGTASTLDLLEDAKTIPFILVRI